MRIAELVIHVPMLRTGLRNKETKDNDRQKKEERYDGRKDYGMMMGLLTDRGVRALVRFTLS
jgi:hypothetical protein